MEKKVKINPLDSLHPNKMFADNDEGFRAACDNAGVQPTARQASKWRNRKGSAFNARKEN